MLFSRKQVTRVELELLVQFKMPLPDIIRSVERILLSVPHPLLVSSNTGPLLVFDNCTLKIKK